MKLSVITPSFNQAHYLEQTLESVHSQAGDFELEHLVIDGGSTDGTVELLEKWSDKLWYCSESDRGQSHALNKGVARATGDIIVWLNSDDYLLPGALQKVVDFFRDRPDVDWAYGRCISVDEKGTPNRKGIYGLKNIIMKNYSYPKLLLANYISQPATFFRRKLYNAVGGVNEDLHYAMDYDLWLRFGQRGDAGFIHGDLSAFRFYSDCKTCGSKDESLREASMLSARYAKEAGFDWVADLNHLLYYKLNGIINKLTVRLKRGDA